MMGIATKPLRSVISPRNFIDNCNMTMIIFRVPGMSTIMIYPTGIVTVILTDSDTQSGGMFGELRDR